MAYRIARAGCQGVFRISVVRTRCANSTKSDPRCGRAQKKRIRRRIRIAPFFGGSYSCRMNATLIAAPMTSSPHHSVIPAGDNSRSDRLWDAVMERNSQMDGKFVYAVRSTGIYCRPTCPSRRPRRNQVEFFAQPEAAERAGFRACLRCRPQLTGADARNHSERAVNQVAELCRAIENNLDAPLKLDSLAAQAGASPHSVLRAFRKTMGITPRQYADAVRLRRLKGQLKKGSDVTTAMYEAGYSSPSRLYESASSSLGMTPGTYLRGGTGMQIAYTIAPCAMGKVLVAATGRGVSAVYLGDKEAPLERALHEEYPRAEIRKDSASLENFVGDIVRHLKGAKQQLDLPLDVQATAFQRRVWEELKRIPYGATRSYSQVARSIGRPKAIRAVARACATNPVSVVVPCHRVVREDGQLAGYRWGLAKKTALLARERKQLR